MTQGKLVKIMGYYNDASYIERVIATFRKLLIDIDWVYGRRIDENGLYEVYLYVRAHPNFEHAILNLSKTVGVERVEIYNSFDIRTIEIEDREVKNAKAKRDRDIKTAFILYIPNYSQVIAYSWGERYGENIS